jgi:hypothetical protein
VSFSSTWEAGATAGRSIRAAPHGRDKPLSINLLTIPQTAARLHVCRNTVLAMMKDGRVQSINLNPAGKRPTWRIVAASLEAFRVEPLAPEVLEDKLREAELERRVGW